MVPTRTGTIPRRCAIAALVAAASLAWAQVKIGVLLPLSGKGAAYGQHQQVLNSRVYA